MSKPDLTAARLRELLHYDPLTGIFTRRITIGRWKAGTRVGSIDANGYVQMSVASIRGYAHQFAVLYMTGEWPSLEVDHEDGIPSNNRWLNLRQGSHQFNLQNQRRARVDNGLGLLGVHAKRRKWRAQITVDGKTIGLGVHATPELAHQAYLDAKRNLHEGCTI